MTCWYYGKYKLGTCSQCQKINGKTFEYEVESSTATPDLGYNTMKNEEVTLGIDAPKVEEIEDNQENGILCGHEGTITRLMIYEEHMLSSAEDGTVR